MQYVSDTTDYRTNIFQGTINQYIGNNCTPEMFVFNYRAFCLPCLGTLSLLLGGCVPGWGPCLYCLEAVSLLPGGCVPTAWEPCPYSFGTVSLLPGGPVPTAWGLRPYCLGTLSLVLGGCVPTA